jgi:hypothetical protein
MRDIFSARLGQGRLLAVLATVAAVFAAGGGAYAATSSSGSGQQHAARTVSKGPFQTSASAFVAGAAVVNSNGTLARSVGVKSATHLLGAGRYQVIFTRKVNRCAFEATLGDPSTGGGPDGQIGVATRSGHKNGVYIATYNSGGGFTDLPFHLVVIC